MNVRRNLFLLSILLLVVAFWLGVTRVLFLAQAERTVGTVKDVYGENARCGRGRRRRRSDCTKFYAWIHFQAVGTESRLRVKAGSTRGHDQPVTFAEYRVGDSVPVLFDPSNPWKAIRDRFWDKWGATGAVLVIGLFSYVGFLREEDTGQIISLQLDKPS